MAAAQPTVANAKSKNERSEAPKLGEEGGEPPLPQQQAAFYAFVLDLLGRRRSWSRSAATAQGQKAVKGTK